jgi:hypothetical protein
VAGIGNGLFAPDESVTCQDLAVLLTRYAQFAGKQLPVKREYAGFADDGQMSDYAKQSVSILYEAGIVGGKPGNFFDPKSSATRAEAAAILRRFIEASR